MDAHAKLQLLAAAAWMDGSIAIPEREMLEALAARLGSSSEKVDQIIDGLRTGEKVKISIGESTDPLKKVALLQQICALLAADHEVTERELVFAKRVGEALDISPKRVENTVQLALAHRRAAAAITGDQGRSLSELVSTLARILDKLEP